MSDIATQQARPRTTTEEKRPHVKARTEKPSDYPERFPVPDNLVKWNFPLSDYAPPRYTSPSTLKKSPDPQECSDLQRIMTSHEPSGVRIDGASGEPLNPRGRTGLSGRGGLYLWGPNHAADFLLTRFNSETNNLEALLIKRRSGE